MSKHRWLFGASVVLITSTHISYQTSDSSALNRKCIDQIPVEISYQHLKWAIWSICQLGSKQWERILVCTTSGLRMVSPGRQMISVASMCPVAHNCQGGHLVWQLVSTLGQLSPPPGLFPPTRQPAALSSRSLATKLYTVSRLPTLQHESAQKVKSKDRFEP